MRPISMAKNLRSAKKARVNEVRIEGVCGDCLEPYLDASMGEEPKKDSGNKGIGLDEEIEARLWVFGDGLCNSERDEIAEDSTKLWTFGCRKQNDLGPGGLTSLPRNRLVHWVRFSINSYSPKAFKNVPVRQRSLAAICNKSFIFVFTQLFPLNTGSFFLTLSSINTSMVEVETVL